MSVPLDLEKIATVAVNADKLVEDGWVSGPWADDERTSYMWATVEGRNWQVAIRQPQRLWRRGESDLVEGLAIKVTVQMNDCPVVADRQIAANWLPPRLNFCLACILDAVEMDRLHLRSQWRRWPEIRKFAQWVASLRCGYYPGQSEQPPLNGCMLMLRSAPWVN